MRGIGRFLGSTGAAIALAFGMGQCTPVAAGEKAGIPAATRDIAGSLTVVGGKADPAKLDVRLNGAPARVTSDGEIAASTAPADHYQLTVKGPGIFDAVFTFGSAEIAGPDRTLVLPPVEVVARAPGRVELFFGGDTMIGRRFEAPARGERVLVRPASRAVDMARLLDPMRPYFAGADLASLNLETVLATSDLGDAPDKTVVFYTHSDAAEVLAKAGIDYVSLGNNHVYDYVEPGLAATTAALDRARLAWSGAGPDEAAAVKAARLDIGGHPYAMLGFVGWKGKVEPNQVAGAAKGGAAFGSDENIAAAVAREVAAGRAPIVQYHGSSEYSDRPTDISERRMKLAIDKGAVLVVSHHPHVAHGLELYKGRLIAYSLGNFLFDQDFPETQATFALKLWMDGDRLFRAEVIPIQILDYRPVPAVGGMRQAALRRIIDLSAERGTSIAVVGGHGTIVPGENDVAAHPCPAPAGPGLASYRYPLGETDAPCPATAGKAEGRDLLLRGDFEAAAYDHAVDRTWEAPGAALAFVPSGHGGGRALQVQTLPGKTATLAPKSFFRAPGARRYSLVGRIRAEAPTRLEALLQEQPRGSSRTSALETAPHRTFGTTTMAAGDWQSFRFDIDLGAGGESLPLRPLLQTAADRPVLFDDLAFVAWDDGAAADKSGPGRSFAEDAPAPAR
jgi:poly-gamma-glutamate capsule biosynthesis protein CapA/YwtB (metallophosphatase superfamily)